jgi:CRP-like cAMP-binding protein
MVVVQEDCQQITAELWRALQNLRSERIYLSGQPLFRTGEHTRGLYLVEEGEVCLFLCSTSGRERLMHKVGPGVILGLHEAMSGEAHKLTAQATGQTQVSFVRCPDLMNFLRQNPIYCMQIVQLLSEDLHSLYHRFVLESSAASRGRKKHGGGRSGHRHSV